MLAIDIQVSHPHPGTHQNLLILLHRLLVIIVYRRLENANVVICDIVQDPPLESDNLFVGHRVRLCDHGDEVDLVVKLAHEFNVDGFQAERRRARHRGESVLCRDSPCKLFEDLLLTHVPSAE